MFISLTLQLCPAQHNIDLVSPAIQKRIVAARKLVETKLGRDNDTIQFIDENAYQTGMTIRDNLLFGKISYNKRHLIGKVNEQLNAILEELGLSSLIAQRGLRFKCGNAGTRLPQGFRQKIALARALIKNPDILIVDNALSTIDSLSQGRILKNIVKLRAGKNLIWTVVDKETSSLFDQLYVIENHSIKEATAI
jgi:ABC-type multidrug transport system fused ATPase/permease subunit